jgi:hypothetical protein
MCNLLPTRTQICVGRMTNATKDLIVRFRAVGSDSRSAAPGRERRFPPNCPGSIGYDSS